MCLKSALRAPKDPAKDFPKDVPKDAATKGVEELRDQFERHKTIMEVIVQIQKLNYVYNLAKGFSNWDTIPPPERIEMNCEAAANLAVKMAEKKSVNQLKLVVAQPKDGFFIPSIGKPLLALGNNEPPVKTDNVSGWEFEKHYRVKDVVTGKVYDPTFGTSDNDNPIGLKCTSTKTDIGKKGKKSKMVSIYGDKYAIIRELPGGYSAELIIDTLVHSKNLVENKDYH